MFPYPQGTGVDRLQTAASLVVCAGCCLVVLRDLENNFLAVIQVSDHNAVSNLGSSEGYMVRSGSPRAQDRGFTLSRSPCPSASSCRKYM